MRWQMESWHFCLTRSNNKFLEKQGHSNRADNVGMNNWNNKNDLKYIAHSIFVLKVEVEKQ